MKNTVLKLLLSSVLFHWFSHVNLASTKKVGFSWQSCKTCWWLKAKLLVPWVFDGIKFKSLKLCILEVEKLISKALCFPRPLVLVRGEYPGLLYSCRVFSSVYCMLWGAVNGHFSSSDLPLSGVRLCEWPDCSGPERIFDRLEFHDSHPWRRYQVSLRRINWFILLVMAVILHRNWNLSGLVALSWHLICTRCQVSFWGWFLLTWGLV